MSSLTPWSDGKETRDWEISLNIDDKVTLVMEDNVWVKQAVLHDLTTGDDTGTVIKIGLWSEKLQSPNSMSSTEKPRDSTRSSVWPCSTVELDQMNL